jgi:hypothetical protein
MGAMKDFDRRIRQGGDDAIAAVSEYVESLHNELARQSRLMHDARIMLVGSPVGSGCYEAFRLLNEEPSPWIPVSERLPEVHTTVLAVTRAFPKDIRLAQMASYDGVMWRFCDMDDDDVDSFGVTHWMPLPEPPEVE